eukprot:6176894-Pleurochrysis_carterae.AAC.1
MDIGHNVQVWIYCRFGACRARDHRQNQQGRVQPFMRADSVPAAASKTNYLACNRRGGAGPTRIMVQILRRYLIAWLAQVSWCHAPAIYYRASQMQLMGAAATVAPACTVEVSGSEPFQSAAMCGWWGENWKT